MAITEGTHVPAVLWQPPGQGQWSLMGPAENTACSTEHFCLLGKGLTSGFHFHDKTNSSWLACSGRFEAASLGHGGMSAGKMLEQRDTCCDFYSLSGFEVVQSVFSCDFFI